MNAEYSLETNVAADFPVVLQLHDEISTHLDPGDTIISTCALSVSEWSIAKHLEHVLMANTSVSGGLKALVEGNLEVASAPDMSRLGKIILGRGVIPRGKAKSPEQFLPSEIPDSKHLREMHSLCSERYSFLENHLDAIQEMDIGFRHHVFGVLSAPVWVRFLHVHTLHHLKIVRDISKALVDQSPRSS